MPFFYDETNNIRKLWLKEENFNVEIDKDFILGGVMCFGDPNKIDVNILKNKLKLQQSVNELKFKYISRKSDFLSCLSEPKVTIFLNWLYENELYIHYSHTDNLFLAIVDIIDTIDFEYIVELTSGIGSEIFVQIVKNELYKIACCNYNNFYQLLYNFNYPNIEQKSIENFYKSIISYIKPIDGEFSFESQCLGQLLMMASEQKELVFLENNKEKIVIENYVSHYLRTIGLFSSAKHIFDDEKIIENTISNFELCLDGIELNNHTFLNSKDEALIQVSDCFVGLIGKYYTFVRKFICDKNPSIDNLSDKQINNFKMLKKIIKKSCDLSELLIHSVSSLEEHNAINKIDSLILSQSYKNI